MRGGAGEVIGSTVHFIDEMEAKRGRGRTPVELARLKDGRALSS